MFRLAAALGSRLGKKMFLRELFLGEGILGGNLPSLTMFSQTTDAKVPAASPGIILNAAARVENRERERETKKEKNERNPGGSRGLLSR